MIIGIICPFKGKQSFEQCLNCSKSNPACDFNEPILSKMFSLVKKKSGITATGLISCLRKSYLELKYEYYQDVYSMYWAFRGQLFHKLTETTNKDYICETQFSRDLDNNIVINGTPDLISLADGIIYDYKSCVSVPKYNLPYRNHTIQLNIYKWLVEGPETSIKINKLIIIYLSMKEIKKIEAPIWDKENIENYLKDRATILYNALNNNIVPNKTTEDTWLCDADWCPVKNYCDQLYNENIKNKIISFIETNIIKKELSEETKNLIKNTIWE